MLIYSVRSQHSTVNDAHSWFTAALLLWKFKYEQPFLEHEIGFNVTYDNSPVMLSRYYADSALLLGLEPVLEFDLNNKNAWSGKNLYKALKSYGPLWVILNGHAHGTGERQEYVAVIGGITPREVFITNLSPHRRDCRVAHTDFFTLLVVTTCRYPFMYLPDSRANLDGFETYYYAYCYELANRRGGLRWNYQKAQIAYNIQRKKEKEAGVRLNN